MSDVPSRRPPALLRWPTYAIGQLYRVGRSRIDAALVAEGLSLRAHHVLACLAEAGTASQQQVADEITMDRSDLVKLLDRLEEGGQISRGRDPDDRRRHLLSLTPSGRRMLRRAEDVVARVTDELLSSLTEEERMHLHTLTLRALGESTEPAQRPGIDDAAGQNR